VGWCILLAVEEEGLKNPSEIAQFVGIDRTATSRALRQLEDEGLISREMGREDRRTTTVTLTEEGQMRLIQARPLCVENMDHFNAKLSAAEAAGAEAPAGGAGIRRNRLSVSPHTGISCDHVQFGNPPPGRPGALDQLLGRHADRGRAVHDPGIVHQDEIEHAGQEFGLRGARRRSSAPAPVEPRNTSTRSSRATSQPSARIAAVSAISCFMPNTSFHVKGFVNHSGHKASQQNSRHKWMRKA
jgi:DNA-binding MarR family transcriptional regulator